MKSVFTVIVLALSLNAMADSNSTLGACVQKAVSIKRTAETKEYVSAIQEGIRNCKEEVKDMVAKEREAKKAVTNAKRIQRLQAQLAKLTK